MELVQWQQRFESWLDEHHASEDSAHDIFALPTRLDDGPQNNDSSSGRSAGGSDRLLFFTTSLACRKIILNAVSHRVWRRAKRGTFCTAISRTFRRIALPAWSTPSRRTVSARVLRRKVSRPKLSRMPIVSKRWARLAWRACLPSRVGWAWHCLTRKIPLPMRARWMTGHLPSIIFRLSCCACLIQSNHGRRELAQHNADFLVHFMAKLSAELQGDCIGLDSQIQHRFCRSLPN